ncbi:hypothetical protein ACOR62_09435 [Neisseria lisongii]|uniref:Integral membrane protein n=1 Tax=Neisseria lisongii TaxID=2912188 RepID=A0AAW5AJ64_9NEIS|nr:hypothetical protein [Neisseria lisongii]MCF7530142.1 hypothetical protein [Neisseria lisongii]
MFYNNSDVDSFVLITLMVTGFIILPILLLTSIVFAILITNKEKGSIDRQKLTQKLSQIIWIATFIPFISFITAIFLTRAGRLWITEPTVLSILWPLSVAIFLIGFTQRLFKNKLDDKKAMMLNKAIIWLYLIVIMIWFGAMMMALGSSLLAI